MQGGARTACALLTAEEERVRERSRAPSGGVGRDLPGPRRSLSPAERKKERDRRACCGGRDWAPYPKQAGNQTERQSVPPHGGSPLGPAKERARERESAVGKGLLQAHLGERGQRSTPKIASPTDWRELTVQGLRARVLSRARSLRKQAKRERERLYMPLLPFCLRSPFVGGVNLNFPCLLTHHSKRGALERAQERETAVGTPTESLHAR